MRKVYLDTTQFKGAIGFHVKDAEVVLAGATIYSMDVNDKNEEYDKYAKDYDIHFIFDDCIPNINFYTIPQVDIMAKDSKGGFIGSLGQGCDLESDTPICYISKELECFIIADNGKDFVRNVESWRNNLEPYDELIFYSSKAQAENQLEFIDLAVMEQMKLINKKCDR